MANASRVAEIFQQASVAFGRLAELTLSLKVAQSEQSDPVVKSYAKWSDDEIRLLKDAIQRFGNDLTKISETIETKTFSQIKAKVKSQALQDAGLSDIPTDAPNTICDSVVLSNLPTNLNPPESVDQSTGEGAPPAKRSCLETGPTSEPVQPRLPKLEIESKREIKPKPDWSTSLKDGTIFIRGTNRPVHSEVKIGAASDLDSYAKEKDMDDSRYEDYEDSSEGGGEADGNSFDSDAADDDDGEDDEDEDEDENEVEEDANDPEFSPS